MLAEHLFQLARSTSLLLEEAVHLEQCLRRPEVLLERKRPVKRIFSSD